MATPQIPEGFVPVDTPEGRKITQGDGIFLLIAPSARFLKDQAFSRLNRRSDQTDSALFPNGSWERSNDYLTGQRNWTERDAIGNEMRTFQTAISAAELDAANNDSVLVKTEAAVLSVSAENVLRNPMLQLIRHVKGQVPGAATVQIRMRSIRTAVGNTIGVELRASQFFSGLSGFVMNASIVDPKVAKFTDVIFPFTFPLASHLPDPVDGPMLTRITAVDLTDAIQSGQRGVLLATLQVQGLARGQTEIAIDVTQMDDDEGFPVRVTVMPSFIAVA